MAKIWHLWKKAHIMASIKKLHIHEGLASVLKVNNTGMQNPPPLKGLFNYNVGRPYELAMQISCMLVTLIILLCIGEH